MSPMKPTKTQVKNLITVLKLEKKMGKPCFKRLSKTT